MMWSMRLIRLCLVVLLLTQCAHAQHRHPRASPVSLAIVDAADASVSASPYERVRGRPYTVTYDERAIVIDGQRTMLLSGSIHYPRASPSMWPQLMASARAAGLNTVQTYVFWNYHEAVKGVMDWSTESRNLTQFLQTAQDAGLFVNLRIGPYVCAEWQYGGLPIWLHDDPAIQFRYYDPLWLTPVEKFIRYVTRLVEPYLARNGGPIILAQIENEYGGAGSDPKRIQYVDWCGNLTVALDIDIPWVMCQQPDAPPPTIYACNGFTCDDYVANQQTVRRQPAMWTENWSGWVEDWTMGKPNRPVEDLAFATLKFIAAGGSYMNYYMWYGGTNWGITQGNQGGIGRQAITQSYDYDAPVDEFGIPHEPKYSHLTEAHAQVRDYAAALMSGPFVPAQPITTSCTLYLYNRSATPVAFVANNDATNTCFVTVVGASFAIPAWSISIIDLTTLTVRYNSHTLSANTLSAATVYAKALAAPLSSTSPKAASVMQWLDRPVPWTGAPVIIQQGPAEQLNATHYRSAYLWYCVNFTTAKPSNTVQLQLTYIADFFYVFIDDSDLLLANGGLSSSSTFQLNLTGLAAGTHTLKIFNKLIGVNNVDINSNTFERIGLLGSVIVNGQDLTKTIFTHVIGTQGEALRIFETANQGKVQWSAFNPSSASSRASQWLQFPLPTPTIVGSQSTATWQFDMSSMNQGHLYVNGFFVGPYWNVLAQTGCGECDFAGGYNPEACRYDCGKPSQSLYQVPRDVLAPPGQDNYVVIFEEQGGDPMQIKLQQRN